MRRILIILSFIMLSASYFSACSEDEVVNPTEEGGQPQESSKQWED